MTRVMNLHTDEARFDAERFSSDILQLLRGLRPVEPEWRAAGLSIVDVRACDDLRLGPLPVERLANHVGVGVPVMDEAVRRLEQCGIAERVQTPADPDVHLVKLTPYGQEIAGEWHAARTHRAAAALAGLSPSDRHALLEVLDKMALDVSRMDAMATGRSAETEAETLYPEPEVLAEPSPTKPRRTAHRLPARSGKPLREPLPNGAAQWAWSR